MTDDIPIACSLDAAQMHDRVGLIEALMHDALTGQQQIPGGLRTMFRDTPSIRGRVRELVAAEERCCPFLSFAIGHHEGTLWIDITGAPDAQPVIDEFFATQPGAMAK